MICLPFECQVENRPLRRKASATPADLYLSVRSCYRDLLLSLRIVSEPAALETRKKVCSSIRMAQEGTARPQGFRTALPNTLSLPDLPLPSGPTRLAVQTLF